MSALSASASGIVFKEFYGSTALGTFDVKDGILIPVLGVLPRAFHDGSPGKWFLVRPV
jgi:hypothetical protein